MNLPRRARRDARLRRACVRAFAQRHRATERAHLRLVTLLRPWPQRSWLLVPWRLADYLIGALPALAGVRAVFGTIAAVESFVDHHYQQQIDHIDALRAAERAAAAPLRALLARRQADECPHRDEATALGGGAPGPLLRIWCALVRSGSALAVKVVRRIQGRAARHGSRNASRSAARPRSGPSARPARAGHAGWQAGAPADVRQSAAQSATRGPTCRRRRPRGSTKAYGAPMATIKPGPARRPQRRLAAPAYRLRQIVLDRPAVGCRPRFTCAS